MLNKFDICFIAGGMLIGAGITALAFLKHEEGLMSFGEAMDMADDLNSTYKSMVDEYRNKVAELKNDPIDIPEEPEIEVKDPLIEATKNTKRIILEHFGYGLPGDEELDDNYVEDVDREPPSEKRSEPYVISKDEYENERFYDKTTLCFYDDGVLEEYLSENIVDDIPRTIGTEFIDKFGEYEDDVVFVRNDSYQTDYEVLRQHRNYAEFPR
jgi:hypothetical protein